MANKLVGFLKNNAGSLINAGSGVVATGLNALFTKRENERNREWTEQQNDLAWNRQRQLIDEQRAYDTPKAQMQRLMEAGLNPNLIYGGVDQSPMAAQTAPSASGKYAGVAPQVDPYVAADVALKMAQIRRLDTESDNETKLTRAQVRKLAADLGVSEAQAEQLHSQVRLADANISKINKEIDVLKQDELAKKIENQFNQETYETRVKQFQDEYKITHEKAERIVAIIQSSIAQAYGSAHLSEAQAKYTRVMTVADKRLKDQMAAFYQNSANKTLTEKMLFDIEKGLKERFGESEMISSILQNLASGNMLATFLKLGHSGVMSVLTGENRIP